MTKELWLFNKRVSLSAGYYPTWEKPLYDAWSNGGTQPNECFDFGVNFWRFCAHFTLWQVGGWSKVLRLIAKPKDS